MKNLHFIFKFSLLQNLLKKKKLALFALILFLMQLYFCNALELIDDFKTKGIIYAGLH